jgi:hypothetical protein
MHSFPEIRTRDVMFLVGVSKATALKGLPVNGKTATLGGETHLPLRRHPQCGTVVESRFIIWNKLA